MTDLDTLSWIFGFVFGFAVAIVLRAIDELVDAKRDSKRLLREGKDLIRQIEELTQRHHIDPPDKP
jgi:hypothetical protein